MQSTGHVEMASATVSSSSPSWLKVRARPKSSSMRNVSGAMDAHIVQPMHVASSTKTMRSALTIGSPSSSTSMSSWLATSPSRSSTTTPASAIMSCSSAASRSSASSDDDASAPSSSSAAASSSAA